MSWHGVLLRSRKIEQVRNQAEGGLTDLPESQTVHYVYGERRVLHALWERRVLHTLGERHVLHALRERCSAGIEGKACSACI